MTQLTPEKIADLERVADAATDGPWDHDDEVMSTFCNHSHPFTDLAAFKSGTTNQTKWPAIYSILGTCKLCDSSVTFPDPECDAEVDAEFADLVRAIHAETDRREREAVQESTHEQGQS